MFCFCFQQSGTMDGSTTAAEDLTNEESLPFNLNEPITDQVILGLDFLLTHSCIVDLKKNVVTIGNTVIPAVLCNNSKTEQAVCRVEMGRRLVIPPNSHAQDLVTINNAQLGDYVITPVIFNQELEMGVDL